MENVLEPQKKLCHKLVYFIKLHSNTHRVQTLNSSSFIIL